MRYSDVVISPLRGHKYKVLEPIRYKDVVVPVGYLTNGANVPRLFWSLYPPNKSDLLPAVIIHDYLCDQEQYEKADQYFDEVLEILQVKKIDRFLLVWVVKIYHKIRYKIHLS